MSASTPYGELRKYLVTINNGIMDTVKKYKMVDELENGKNTDFVPNILNHINKQWSWAKHNPELVMEMLAEVYMRVFVTRANSVFKGYIPKGQEGHESHLEGWLDFVLKRAFQEVSKLKTSEMKRFKEINPMDGQSIDDAIDHLVHNTKVKTTQEYSDRMEDLNEYLSYYEDRLKHLLENDPKNVTRLNSFKKRIEQIEEEIDLLEKESMFNKDKQYDKDEIEHPMTHDEKLFFDKMINDMRKLIRQTEENPDPQLQVFNLLIDGYSPLEISKVMNVSTAKISQRIKKIKETIQRLAKNYKQDGDSDLFKSLTKMMENGGKRVANRMPMAS